jgi:hypothetical protein
MAGTRRGHRHGVEAILLSSKAIPKNGGTTFMQRFQSHLGRVIAGLGGVFALYAFLGMPWISFGWLGSYTAAQVMQLASQTFHDQFLSSLWLALAGAGAVIVLSVLGSFSPQTEPGPSIALILLGTAALLGCIGIYAYLSQQELFTVSLATLLSTGFWFYAFSMILALSGGCIQIFLRGKRQTQPPTHMRSQMPGGPTQ